jgi:ribosomal protein L33
MLHVSVMNLTRGNKKTKVNQLELQKLCATGMRRQATIFLEATLKMKALGLGRGGGADRIQISISSLQCSG